MIRAGLNVKFALLGFWIAFRRMGTDCSIHLTFKVNSNDNIDRVLHNELTGIPNPPVDRTHTEKPLIARE